MTTRRGHDDQPAATALDPFADEPGPRGPSGSFRDTLEALGFDVKNPHARYSGEQWAVAVRWYRDHELGDRDDADAFRECGRLLVRAYLGTGPGRLLRETIAAQAPAGFLSRLPQYARLWRTDLQVDVAVREREATVTLIDPTTTPAEVSAGMLQTLLKAMGVAAEVQVAEPVAGHAALAVRW